MIQIMPKDEINSWAVQRIKTVHVKSTNDSNDLIDPFDDDFSL